MNNELLLDTLSVLKQVSNLRSTIDTKNLEGILGLKQQCTEFILQNLDLLFTKDSILSAIDQDLIYITVNNFGFNSENFLNKSLLFTDKTQNELNIIFVYCGNLKLSLYISNENKENNYLASIYLKDLIKIMYE